VQGFSNTAVPFYERFFLGGDFDIRGFDFRAVSPIASVVRNIATVDPETGNTINRPFDDIVYVGGDTQGVANLEYRIPLVGNIVIMAPFLDIGNTWVLKKDQLRREFTDSEGNLQTEGVKFLPGTNSGIRTSTGVEFQVMMPVINAPFRLIFAFNPNRIDRTYLGTATGLPFHIFEKGRDFKFTVGRTF
jgi:outer membrane protein insertion porin family